MKKILSLIVLGLSLLSTSNAQDIQKDSLMAEQLQDSVKYHREKGNHNKVIYYYKQVSGIYNKLYFLKKSDYYLDKMIKINIHMSKPYSVIGKTDTASIILKQSIQQIQNKSSSKNGLLGEAYCAMGFMYARKMISDSAIHYFNRSISSLEIEKKTHIYTLSFDYYYIAYELIYSQDYHKALVFLDKASSLLKDTIDPYNILPTIYTRKGRALTFLADYDNAFIYFQKALETLNKFPAKNSYKIENVFNLISDAYIKKGEYYKALEYARKSLYLSDNKRVGNYRIKIILGIIYRNIGQIEKAQEYNFEALSHFTKTYGKDHIYIRYIYDCICVTYIKSKQYDLAMQYASKSLETINKIYKKDQAISEVTESMAEIYLLQGKYDEALKHFKTSLELCNEKSPALKIIYFGFGETFYRKKEYHQAIHYFQQALMLNIFNFRDSIPILNTPPSSAQYFNALDLLTTIHYKAKCFEKIAESNESLVGYEKTSKNDLYQVALQHYLFCDSLVSSLRVLSNYKSDKLELTKSATPIYNDAIELCYQLADKSNDIREREEYLEKAFHFSQKTKANILEEAIISSNAKSFAGIPDSLIQKENSLKVEIAGIKRKIAESSDSILIQESQERLFDINRRFETLVNLFEKDYPQFYNLKYEQRLYGVKEIQDHLDKTSALIDYYTTDSLIYAFVFTNDDFNLIKTPTTGIDKLIKDFRTSIYAYSNNEDFEKYGSRDFLENGKALYNLTLKPIESHIKWKTKLSITSTGMMSLLPFEALVSSYNKQSTPKLKDLDYLIKKYEFSYHYSTRLWANSIKKSNQQLGLKDQIMCFAPVFEATEETAENHTAENKGYTIDENGLCSVSGTSLSPLPASKKAVEEIAKIAAVNGKIAEKFIFKDASKANFIELANNNKYILIATHGMANDEIPDLSGLFFANQTSGNENISDNFLSSGEIYNLELNTDLLVLYACETGVGKVVEGEGVMTLTRGFIYAGASNIIQSLWSISDASTKDLVVHFFDEVYKGKSYSESLRLAKLNMIDYGVIPFHWSGVVLVGN